MIWLAIISPHDHHAALINIQVFAKIIRSNVANEECVYYLVVI